MRSNVDKMKICKKNCNKFKCNIFLINKIKFNLFINKTKLLIFFYWKELNYLSYFIN